ncbi:MAG: hypothetical protein ACRCT8_17290 [Lacipirellulaceae bacterium]
MSVHRHVGEWFEAEEVYAWIGRHLSLIAEPSMRHYVRAAELNAAGIDWVGVIGAKFLPAKTLLVARLRDDERFASEAERVAEFSRPRGGSRATYVKYARRLEGRVTRPQKVDPLANGDTIEVDIVVRRCRGARGRPPNTSRQLRPRWAQCGP